MGEDPDAGPSVQSTKVQTSTLRMSLEEEKKVRMTGLSTLTGLVLLVAAASTALPQDDYPKVETSPAFMYIRTPLSFEGHDVSLNCAGGGGTFAYNITSVIGLAADLGGCKFFSNAITVAGVSLGKITDGTNFTFLFGPRLTYRHGRFHPFGEFNAGGDRVSLTCQSSALTCTNATNGATFTKTVFAFTAGGGADIQLSRKFALRLVQAEYLYTRFGNDCPFAVCSRDNNQNSFRLKSGIVIGWGGSASK